MINVADQIINPKDNQNQNQNPIEQQNAAQLTISIEEPLLNPGNSGIELSKSGQMLENKNQDITEIIDTADQQKEKLHIVHVPMRKTKIRFLALAMAALLMFGNNYSFDNPQALQKPIMTDIGVSSPQYNLLYTIFSFPNIFLTLAGGFMIDLLGVRIGIFVFTTMVLISQTIVAIGGTFKIFWVMLLGRGFFGISSENLIISQSAIISKWFRGSELSLAIGIIMTFPEIASALNSLLSPFIYEKTQSLAYPLFVSVGVCFLSLICAIVLIILDKKAEKQQADWDLEDDDEEEEEIEEKVSFKDIKEFSVTFWILVTLCMLTLGIYIPFLDDANDFYQEKFKFSPVEAGRLLMIPYLISAVTCPIIGTIVDRIGRRRLLIIFTCFLFSTSCLLFGLLQHGEEDISIDENEQKIIYNPNMTSILPLILLGLSFSFYSSVLIPSVQYVVTERVMGTAFGLMGMLESIAMATFPLIAASIVTSSKDQEIGYSNAGFFYFAVALLGLILSFSLYIVDKKNSVVLDFINPENPSDREKLIFKKYNPNLEESDESDDDEEDSMSQSSNKNSIVLEEEDKNSSQLSLDKDKQNPQSSVKKSKSKSNLIQAMNEPPKDQILGT